jgi:hypothetical protein
MWVVELLLAATAFFIGVALIYVGICGLSGRSIYLPARGVGSGVTVSGVGARLAGAMFLVGGIVLCWAMTREVLLS